MLSLYVSCKSQGVRWPLHDEDEVEVWAASGSALVFVISGAVMGALVQQYLDALALKASRRHEVEPAPPRESERAPSAAPEAVEPDKGTPLPTTRRARRR